MASYTGMRELKNHVHKSGADVGMKNCFTAKVGELLPTYWDLAIPNCTYDINVEYFTRTRPVQTSAYTRVREYFDFYAVPLKLLWKSAGAALTQMGQTNSVQSLSLDTPLTVSSDLPFCSLSNLSFVLARQAGDTALGTSLSVPEGFGGFFHFNQGDVSHKLFTYLGYGNIVSPTSSIAGGSNRWYNCSSVVAGSTYTQRYRFNASVNILPLLAYQKIYQDFFRWSQWENADPTCYNVDYYAGTGPLFTNSSLPAASSAYWKRPNMFSLRYANWNKDILMGILPNSQFGDVAVLSSSTADGNRITIPAQNVYFGDTPSVAITAKAINRDSTSTSLTAASASSINISSNTVLRTHATSASLSGLAPSFNILALRQAEAMQKWKEISQSVDQDYRSQIQAHFGISPSQADSCQALYIGGLARNLDISEVVNTQLDSADSQSYIYGKGVGTGQGYMRYTTGGDYSVLMCIYHAVPLADYDLPSCDGQLLVTDVESMPIPEFDSIGMQAVPAIQFLNSPALPSTLNYNTVLGYNTRYYNWKGKLDVVRGAFTTTLKDWVAPINTEYLASMFSIDASGNGSITYPFFKVNPHVLDSIFAVAADSTWNTDQLLVNANFDVKVVHPLSADGIPY